MKKGKDLKVYLSDRISMSDGIKIGSTDDNTNRTVIHYDSESPTHSVMIDKLIRTFVENGRTDLKNYFARLVKNFTAQLVKTNKVFYRGISALNKDNLKVNRIGPSPKPKDNRYSVEGEHCLYLIDDWNFLCKELATSSLLIQKYDNIPFENIRLGDLSSENKALDNSLALSFQRAESGRTAAGYNFEGVLQQKGQSKYLVSQLLASSFKNAGWDGFLIPGIQGGSGSHYRNLTIWGDALDNWRKWATMPFYQKEVNGSDRHKI